jgi:hypothetical protein
MQKNLLFSQWICLFLSGMILAIACPSMSATEPLHIMALGDSITAGYTNNPSWTVPFGFGYRSGLYTRLTDANYPFQFTGGSQEPFNGVFGVPQTVSPPDLRTFNQNYHRGYGGWGADSLTTYIPYWLNSDQPDVILLMIGINNIGQGSSADPTTAKTNLNTLVQTIYSKRPDIFLIVAQITPYYTYTSSIVQYNNYIKNTLVPNYASQGRKISTVDQYSNFLTGSGVINTSLFSNGINHPNATGYDRMAQTWFDGIQALGSIATPPTPAQPVLANGNFETWYFTANTHNVNPSGTHWTFTSASLNVGSGIDQGNPYGVANSTPASGAQMGFLQGLGSGNGICQMTQNMAGLVAGKTYSLSFQAKGSYNGINSFSVSLDGTNLSFSGSTLLTPSAVSAYTSYSTTFTATSPATSLRFYDTGNIATTKVSWIDNIKLGLITPSGENLVANGTFEATNYSANSHNVNPSGTGWRFTPSSLSAGSGINRGNPYGTTNAPNGAPFEGNQYAFLQGSGSGNGVTSIEQDVSGFQSGASYRLSFESASIEGASGTDPFSVSIGGTPVTFNSNTMVSPSASYGLYISDPFVATGSTMTLRFHDAGNVPSGQSSWLDDVQITLVPEPSSGVALLSLVAFAGLCCHGRRRGKGKD